MRLIQIGSCVFLMIAALGCNGSPDVIATCGGDSITVAELDEFLLTLPETARQKGPDQTHEAFIEAVLGDMAVERALMETETAREIFDSPRADAMRTAGKVSLLVDRLMTEISRSYVPDSEEVERLRTELSKRADNGVIFTFGHIFLRIDNLDSAAEVEKTRSKATELMREARTGADFSELAKRHSDSADAGMGGMVSNVASADLDESTRRVLMNLDEGAVSDVVESRTGLHVFKLKRRLEVEGPGADKIELTARQLASRKWVNTQRVELLDRLRTEARIETDGLPMRVGSWVLDEESVSVLAPDLDRADERMTVLVDQLLLADEALDRGLWTPDAERAVEKRVRAGVLEKAFRKEREAYSRTLLEDRLRPFYEAQPSAYVSPETADIDLIFVPEGKDAFQSQRAVEKHVADLRAGASFSDLARKISKGPAVDDGGALGTVPRTQWAIWGQAVGKAIRTLEPGQISDPIYCTDRVLSGSPAVLKGGFAIVRVNEFTPETQRSFEEAVESVRKAFVMKNQSEINDEVNARLKKRIGFKIRRIPSAEELGR